VGEPVVVGAGVAAEPHRQVVEVLPIPVGRLAYPETPRTPEHRSRGRINRARG
jgi:hypothetical protein